MREIQETEEKALAQQSSESSIMNYLRVQSNPHIRVGKDFQANVPAVSELKKSSGKSLKCVWNASENDGSQVENFLEGLESLIKDPTFSHERALKHYIQYEYDNSSALASIKKNKTYYKNLFCKGPVLPSKELKKLI